MKPCKHHLSLDQPARYQINVQGRLDKDWADWFDNLSLSWETDAYGQPVTVFTGPVVDQAALHGLLYRLYSLGLPLLSVTCLDTGPDEPAQ
ncbi:MAG: hypothetical protein FOGNACKC_05261 [Anaerolineae bacterium]|nr:hypothetical protein [Anaerolineae bacterium]